VCNAVCYAQQQSVSANCHQHALVHCLFVTDIRAVDDRFARTALHFACRAGGVNTLRLLLQRGADINAVTSVGNTGTIVLLPMLVLLLLLLLPLLMLWYWYHRTNSHTDSITALAPSAVLH
jgi:ankyrin repeat protein